MNLPNALGFFLLGLAMMAMPELVQANATFDEEAALWLEFMGVVNFLIGSGCTARCLAAALPKSTAMGKPEVSIRVGEHKHSLPPADGNRATV